MPGTWLLTIVYVDEEVIQTVTRTQWARNAVLEVPERNSQSTAEPLGALLLTRGQGEFA